jgi:hypothetical protein
MSQRENNGKKFTMTGFTVFTIYLKAIILRIK